MRRFKKTLKIVKSITSFYKIQVFFASVYSAQYLNIYDTFLSIDSSETSL